METVRRSRHRAVALLAVAVLATSAWACDPTIEVTIKNRCEIPVWVWVGGHLERFEGTATGELPPGEALHMPPDVGDQTEVGWVASEPQARPDNMRFFEGEEVTVTISGDDCPQPAG